jgi:hypothetical protein
MNAQIMEQINNMTYSTMLRRWRFAEVGDPIFQGETGDYFKKVMELKKIQADHVGTSKSVGWDRL